MALVKNWYLVGLTSLGAGAGFQNMQRPQGLMLQQDKAKDFVIATEPSNNRTPILRTTLRIRVPEGLNFNQYLFVPLTQLKP